MSKKLQAPAGTGAGGKTVACATSLPPTPDKGNGIVGYGCPAYRRARDLSIAAGLIAMHNPTPHELEVIIASWRSPRVYNIATKVCELLLERTAPAAINADESYFRALDREPDTRNLIGARLGGWLPRAVVELVALAGAAAAHGRLRLKSKDRKGARHAA